MKYTFLGHAALRLIQEKKGSFLIRFLQETGRLR